jgi:hypothetical protein
MKFVRWNTDPEDSLVTNCDAPSGSENSSTRTAQASSLDGAIISGFAGKPPSAKY